MSWSVVLREGCKDLINSSLPNVYQHVSIGKPFHSSRLIALQWRQKTVQNFSAIILFENFFICHRSNSVVVELQPPSIPVGLDESEIVAAMQISRVDENTMQLVYPVLILFGDSLVNIVCKVDFKGELVSVVDLSYNVSKYV